MQSKLSQDNKTVRLELFMKDKIIFMLYIILFYFIYFFAWIFKLYEGKLVNVFFVL